MSCQGRVCWLDSSSCTGNLPFRDTLISMICFDLTAVDNGPVQSQLIWSWGWATPMPFASINPTNQRTNPWNFQKKNIENWQRWKMTFFWVGHFDFFFKKKKFFFASFPWKSAQIYMVEWMGQNFDVFAGFQKIPCYA